jgi:hypothetical protein
MFQTWETLLLQKLADPFDQREGWWTSWIDMAGPADLKRRIAIVCPNECPDMVAEGRYRCNGLYRGCFLIKNKTLIS